MQRFGYVSTLPSGYIDQKKEEEERKRKKNKAMDHGSGRYLRLYISGVLTV